MVGILDRCGSKAIRGIIVKSLSEFFVYGDTSDYHESYLAVIKLWVKVLSLKNPEKLSRFKHFVDVVSFIFLCKL